MTFDTYTIIYLITNLFSIAVNHRFMMAFFDKRRTKRWICVSAYFLYFFVISFVYLYVDIPFVMLFANLILVYLICLNYEASILKHVLSTLYTIAFCVFTEVIVIACTGLFQYSLFDEGGYSNSLGAIAIPMVTYMEALLLYNSKLVKRNQKVNLSVWCASVMIPITTFVLFAFIVNSSDVAQSEVIVAAVLILMVNVVTFYLYDSLAASYLKLAESAVLEKERELYYNQCTMMQDSTNELRAFRHDLKNQLIGVSELMGAENYEEAKTLVSELSGKLNAKSLFSTTGNVPMDSIINYKLHNTGNEQVRVETEISVPAEINMGVSDCITILGNLLDNALFAVYKVGEDKRYLKLKVVFDKGCLMIQCTNPYVTEVQYKDGKIVSAKKNQKEHGFGLKNIEAVVEKYSGCMEICHENGVFAVDVVLYLPVDCKK